MGRVQRIRVSQNRRFLVQEDGTPFFWLGDTAWELIHKLNRENAEKYLKNRAERQFNVVQAVALAELEGLQTPNAYGRRPLKRNDRGVFDPTMPDVEDGTYDYWDHLDFIIDKAADFGIYIALLPTWGDKYHQAWGKGPEIFHAENAKVFGQWLGERYKDRTNIIWVLGGDRHLLEYKHFEVNRALAEGIKAGDEGNHLLTFHPPGGYSSSRHVHNEGWLDFNMIQSGHGEGVQQNYLKVKEDYEKLPIKPTLDAEPCYEDHPIGFNPDNGYFDESDVRQAAYYAVFAGGFGHTYGHHSIWSMSTGQFHSVDFSKPGSYFIMDWEEALQRPGGAQMQHLKKLIESRSFLDRIPDQQLIIENRTGANYMVATRGKKYALIYSPNGLDVNVRMGVINGENVQASWFNPRTGEYTSIGVFKNADEKCFRSPSRGRGNDWVLVLDSIK